MRPDQSQANVAHESSPKQTAKEFLLSIAGMFDSGKPYSRSDKVKETIAQAIERKHGKDSNERDR